MNIFFYMAWPYLFTTHPWCVLFSREQKDFTASLVSVQTNGPAQMTWTPDHLLVAYCTDQAPFILAD